MAAVLRTAYRRPAPPRIPSEQIDRPALEEAWKWLGLKMPLDQMLESRAHRLVLENVARRVMQKREQAVDLKKRQANDND